MKRGLLTAWLLLAGGIGYNLCLWLPLWIVGMFVFELQWALRRQVTSPITGRTITNGPRWLWLWNNDEDGLLPPEGHPFLTAMRAKGRSTWWIAFWWTAMRNPVNNLKYVPWINPRQPVPTDEISFYAGSRLVLRRWRGYVLATFYTSRCTCYFGWRLYAPGFMSSKDGR